MREKKKYIKTGLNHLSSYSKEYKNTYARMRTLLYRLEHPRKTPGRPKGQKDKRQRVRITKAEKELSTIRRKYDWDRT